MDLLFLPVQIVGIVLRTLGSKLAITKRLVSNVSEALLPLKGIINLNTKSYKYLSESYKCLSESLKTLRSCLIQWSLQYNWSRGVNMCHTTGWVIFHMLKTSFNICLYQWKLIAVRNIKQFSSWLCSFIYNTPLCFSVYDL